MNSARRWVSREGRFVVVLSEGAADELDKVLRGAQSLETGGILIGSYDATHRVAMIEEATGPPADSSAGATWFRRGTRLLAEKLRRRWRAARRTYYLGDWHYHPAHVVEPSDEDFEQMLAIANDVTYRCPEPVMLIVGLSAASATRPMRVFVTLPDGTHAELLEANVPVDDVLR